MPIINTCPICGADNVRTLVGNKYRCESCDTVFRMPAEAVWNEKSTAQIYGETIRSILEISCIKNGEELCGTGVIISRGGYILTSAHIVEHSGDRDPGIKNFSDIIVAKRKPDEKIFKAELIYSDPGIDLALLYLREAAQTGGEPLNVGNTSAGIGERVCVIGNSKGEGLCVVNGIVSDSLRHVGKRDLMMITAPVTNGYSGAPVMDNYGRFVGIVTGGRDGATAMNYAIPAKAVNEFIEKARKSRRFRL